jgi:Sec-independent protein secretion pathway component TatC
VRRILRHKAWQEREGKVEVISTNMMYYLFAGILIISLIFLTPPWTVTNVIIGIVPLVFLLFILIAIVREKKRQKNSAENTDSQAQ